jgi:hypothetical protein
MRLNVAAVASVVDGGASSLQARPCDSIDLGNEIIRDNHCPRIHDRHYEHEVSECVAHDHHEPPITSLVIRDDDSSCSSCMDGDADNQSIVLFIRGGGPSLSDSSLVSQHDDNNETALSDTEQMLRFVTQDASEAPPLPIPATVITNSTQPSSDIITASLPTNENSVFIDTPQIQPDDVAEFNAPTTIEEIPEAHKDLILHTLLQLWGIDHARDFQVEAIHQLAFTDDNYLYLIRKTGEGKSAVPLTVAYYQRGIAIMMVPLIGLGSDQVSKSNSPGHRIESYHLDEHKFEDLKKLRQRLIGMSPNEVENTTILLFASPQSLTPKSKWFHVLNSLFDKGYISFVCIDEAHCVEQCGRSFRPEFQDAVKTLSNYLNNDKSIPFLAMSATFRREDQESLSKQLRIKPNYILWGNMDRRSIMIKVCVVGDPSKSMKAALSFAHFQNDGGKTLIYTNSRHNAEESLTKLAESVLSILGSDGDVIALTGDCGVMMKVLLMDAFCGDFNEVITVLVDDEAFNDEELQELEDQWPNLRIMPVTSAANCGLSSPECNLALRNSIPPNLYDLLQEMGRVDRHHSATAGDHRYEIHVSMYTVVSLFVRINTCESNIERQRQINDFYLVMELLLVPSDCFHTVLERYFENPSVNEPKNACGNFCSFCDGSLKKQIGMINKINLIDVITCEVFHAGPCAVNILVKQLKLNKGRIFKKSTMPTSMGPIHAVALQLISTGIIEMYVDAPQKIRTHKLSKKDMFLKLGINTTANGKRPVYRDNSVWDNICHFE